MNGKQITLGIVLANFLALTAYTVWAHGYVGFFELMLANAATVTADVDLAIALSLIGLWLWRDARDRGISPVPYLLVTAALGSAGPLLYLIRIAGAESRRPVGSPARAPAHA